MLGTRKIWAKTASQALNEQLARSLTSSQSKKATKSPSSDDTLNTAVRSLKRKRSPVTAGEERTLETLHRTGKISHREDSMLEDCNGAVHLGSLNIVDPIRSYTQAFGNSTPHLYPNDSNNDPPLAENTVDGNPLTHEGNNFGHTRPSQTETAGGDWSHFYAGDGTNQDQWDFGTMEDSAHCNSSLFNVDGLDWNSFYATLDNLNNIHASEVWTGAQSKATDI